MSTAKDLVEAACKLTIERGGGTVPGGVGLPAVFKEALRVGGRNDAGGDLGRSLAAAVQRLAELRNAVGSGYGRASQPAVGAREARLAASAACALALFILTGGPSPAWFVSAAPCSASPPQRHKSMHRSQSAPYLIATGGRPQRARRARSCRSRRSVSGRARQAGNARRSRFASASGGPVAAAPAPAARPEQEAGPAHRRLPLRPVALLA